jgi:LasA protease
MSNKLSLGKILDKACSRRNFALLAGFTAVGLGLAYGFSPKPQQQGFATVEKAVLEASLQGKMPSTSKVYTEVKRDSSDWAFGIANIASNVSEPPSPRLFIAQKVNQGWVAHLDSTEDFPRMVKQAPQVIVDSKEKALFTKDQNSILSWLLPKAEAGDNSASLSLPWSQGQSWNFNGGPHAIVSGSDLAALDFAGGNQQVKAARDGLAYTSCRGSQVVVVHPGGFKTAYYHLQNTRTFNGQSIGRGEYLGDTGTTTGCGGSATGRHVHFSLQLNNVPQSWNGRDIGGWTIYNGNSPYNGRAVKNGQTVYANAVVGNALLYNDGSFGSTPPVSGQKTYYIRGIGSIGDYALNTNNAFPRIDGFPKMSSWKRDDADSDQMFERLAGATGTLLKHKSTGGCLNAYRRWDGAEMNVWSPCNANDRDQNWTFVNKGDGSFQIQLTEIKPLDNKKFCVDMPGRANYGKVHLWTCDASMTNLNQLWRTN